MTRNDSRPPATAPIADPVVAFTVQRRRRFPFGRRTGRVVVMFEVRKAA